jgi:predicted enzyme related to lactoylglutathione lyase
MGLDSVAIVTVWVKDLEAAIDFYTGALELEKGMDDEFGEGDRFVTVAPPGGGTQIAIRPDREGRAGQMTGIVFGSDDPRAAAEELKGRGVEFVQEPEEQEWGGVMGLFADPDGNQFVIHSRE